VIIQLNEPLTLTLSPSDGAREQDRRPRVGFTLIELLVVIVIIAILASLLLPALSQGKAMARTTKCASNQRQLMLAMQMYVTDHGGYPDGESPNLDSKGNYLGPRGGPGNGVWWGDLIPYLSETKPLIHTTNYSLIRNYSGIWRCPSQPVKPKPPPPQSVYDFSSYASYGYNYRGSAGAIGQIPHMFAGLGYVGPAAANSGPVRCIGVRESEVKAPSDMIGLADGYGVSWVGPADPDPHLFEWIFLEHIDPGSARISAKPKFGTAAHRHSGKLNVAFCDGHIERIRPFDLFFNIDAKWLRKWNRDNDPHLGQYPAISTSQ
jgi:prepilin-type N-terminal cleavage/methylation domain-containing protein/prepilin-type processing-associated H-X9-DG protein